ncbi:hypothetical protein KC19_5G041400 [Ceratodon purpureus]|uniref:Uncharacterized protein n=1 Tax=Ceratodon purpureus TaxID=3225 RepID=A0A8T0HZU7_CERPU|nr:hypothetical protein KC19_5G041400 [Ceratodon purpureus]
MHTYEFATIGRRVCLVQNKMLRSILLIRSAYSEQRAGRKQARLAQLKRGAGAHKVHHLPPHHGRLSHSDWPTFNHALINQKPPE